jgi:hypothetical protein
MANIHYVHYGIHSLSLFTLTGEKLTNNQKAKNNFNITKKVAKDSNTANTVKVAHHDQNIQKKEYPKDQVTHWST